MPQDLPQPRSRWPQFSLWFLLFVIPTVAGIVFSVYSAFAAQDKRFRDLMAEQALLIQECSEVKARMNGLAKAEESLEKLINARNSPESVLFDIEMTLPSWYSMDESGPAYFFLQANDQQLHDLVDLLIERFPDSHPRIKPSILARLSCVPEYVVPERLEGLRDKVRKFAEPLQFDSDERIQQLAAETLFAFNSPSPLREDE